jgi:DNA-binding CsgD family transcriptional regulator
MFLPANAASLPLQMLSASGRSAEELSGVVHQIYEAVAQPQNWYKVVGAIAESLDAHCGCLFTPYTRPQEGGFVFPWRMDESHLMLWGSKYIDHDIWSQSVAEKDLWREGNVLVDEQMVPRDVLAQSVFYREFLSTMNIGRVCAGMLLDGAPGLPTTCLSVYRPFDAPAFSAAEVAWYRLLIPHLSRALGLLHRLDALRVQNQSLLSALNRLKFGACLLDDNGQVLHMNDSARSVIERADGLVVDQKNCLVGHHRALLSSQAGLGLKQWIAEQLGSSKQYPVSTTHFSNAFIQPRKEPGKKYALQCCLLPASSLPMAENVARMVLFITDPDSVQLPQAGQLINLYGLTKSQARVALELAQGFSYNEVAGNLQVAESTVASHVREVYAKLKINRQSDLIRHIMALGQASV